MKHGETTACCALNRSLDSSSQLWISGPHTLVDGKYLAMQLIVNGKASENIRELTESDIHALDDYMQRCKLPGSFSMLFVFEM